MKFKWLDVWEYEKLSPIGKWKYYSAFENWKREELKKPQTRERCAQLKNMVVPLVDLDVNWPRNPPPTAAQLEYRRAWHEHQEAALKTFKPPPKPRVAKKAKPAAKPKPIKKGAKKAAPRKTSRSPA
jgi:hypothetical protein